MKNIQRPHQHIDFNRNKGAFARQDVSPKIRIRVNKIIAVKKEREKALSEEKKQSSFAETMAKAGRLTADFALEVVNPLVELARYIMRPAKIAEDIKKVRSNYRELTKGGKIYVLSAIVAETAGFLFAPLASGFLAKYGIGEATTGFIVGNYIACVFAFQVAWFAQMWKAYKHEYKSGFKSFFEAERDLVKLHLRAVIASAGLYLFDALAMPATNAATGSAAAAIAGISLTSIFASLAYIATMSVVNSDLYPRISGLLAKYDESKKQAKPPK